MSTEIDFETQNALIEEEEEEEEEEQQEVVQPESVKPKKEKKPKLNAKNENFMAFGFWFAKYLQNQNTIDQPTYDVLINALLVKNDNVPEQINFYDSFTGELKNHVKELKLYVKESKKAITKSKKARQPRKPKDTTTTTEVKPKKGRQLRKPKDTTTETPVVDSGSARSGRTVELPVVELPVVELPVVELPVVELPVVEPPVVEPPPVVESQAVVENNTNVKKGRKPKTKKSE
jgi:hypothetical protein